MKRGRLLIVSPSFHGYWRSIEAAFARLGWEASTHVYDAPASPWQKARLKLLSELPARVGLPDLARLDEERSVRARTAVHLAQPDRVLVVKGDRLGEPFWDALDRPRVPRALWLYDELRRTRYTTEALRRFDAVASYSRSDVAAVRDEGIPATFVPLAFDPAVPFVPRQTNEVTFVGARYDQRERLLRGLAAAGVPVRAYGRDWSGHPFDRMRTWRLTAQPFPTGRDLSLTEAYALMAGAPATLNIHGDQDGFTMRTFEAAGVGGVELLDRPDVAEFYDPGTEVAVFSSPEELLELSRRTLTDDRWGDHLRRAARARTLAEHTFDHRARALEAAWQ